MADRVSHQYQDAFKLMWYACPCGHRERIWNSRNGVTPFGGVPCPSCPAPLAGYGLGLSHVDYHLDEAAPHHILKIGQRFFRDGTVDDAIAIIERRIVKFRESGKPMPGDIAELLLEQARTQTGGEWPAGWPMADRR